MRVAPLCTFRAVARAKSKNKNSWKKIQERISFIPYSIYGVSNCHEVTPPGSIFEILFRFGVIFFSRLIALPRVSFLLSDQNIFTCDAQYVTSVRGILGSILVLAVLGSASRALASTASLYIRIATFI